VWLVIILLFTSSMLPSSGMCISLDLVDRILVYTCEYKQLDTL
jgi:hypothetical protein